MSGKAARIVPHRKTAGYFVQDYPVYDSFTTSLAESEDRDACL